MRRLFSVRYLLEPIETRYGDLALLVCCFVTGMLDATSLNNWGVFVGMQTGNTVILGLSTASLPSSQPHASVTTIVSICSFFIGALTTFILSRRSKKLLRITPALALFTQGALIILAAALFTTSLAPQDPDGGGTSLHDIRIVTAIPPLAFQSGMQIATSRILKFSELPTTVLTSTYTDLAGDPNLLGLRGNRKRDRRVGAVIGVLSGAIVSAWIMKKTEESQIVLWIAAGLKIATSLCLFLGLQPVENKDSSEDVEGARKGIITQ